MFRVLRVGHFVTFIAKVCIHIYRKTGDFGLLVDKRDMFA